MDELELLYTQKQDEMTDYGVPDLARLFLAEVQLPDLIKYLPPSVGTEIAACCARKINSSKKCHNSVCPRCSTLFRVQLAKNFCHSQHDERLRSAFVTYVPAGYTAKLGNLTELNQSAIVSKLLSSFAEAWSTSKSIILVAGSPDVSYNEDPRNLDRKLTPAQRKQRHEFHVHFHFVIVAENPELLAQKLKDYVLQRRLPLKGEFRATACYCTARSILYSTKCKPVRRAATRDKRGNRDRQTRPLSQKPKAEAVRWLASAPEDVRFFTFWNQGRTTP